MTHVLNVTKKALADLSALLDQMQNQKLPGKLAYGMSRTRSLIQRPMATLAGELAEVARGTPLETFEIARMEVLRRRAPNGLIETKDIPALEDEIKRLKEAKGVTEELEQEVFAKRDKILAEQIVIEVFKVSHVHLPDDMTPAVLSVLQPMLADE